jgi:crossover junction endodeoxyribonuclease RuvC
MKILGIDPGLERVGFGLIHRPNGRGNLLVPIHWGMIRTLKEHSIAERLSEIYSDTAALLQQTQPDWVSVESLFYFRNHTTLVPVAQARGVILLAVQQAGVPMTDYTPMQVKQTLTGYGKASKKEVQEAVQQTLGITEPIRPDDAADGLALAITHCRFT